MSSPAPAGPHWPVILVLPDRQRLQVRLYERQELPDRWVYKVGMPAYVTLEGGRARPSEYTVWVTADLLEPMWAVNYPQVPAHRLQAELPPERPGWMLCILPGGRRRTLVHETSCERAAGGGREMDTMEALDALMRPGTGACHDCAAAEILVQALELGSGYT